MDAEWRKGDITPLENYPPSVKLNVKKLPEEVINALRPLGSGSIDDD
jgi:hypothetical protein